MVILNHQREEHKTNTKEKEIKTMTEEMKKSCYESYLGDFYYEWGTYKGAMTYEEFCEDCDKFGWDLI